MDILKPVTFDPTTKEVIENMFQALADDLSGEKDEEQAGWRTYNELGMSPTTRDAFYTSRILEKNSEGKVLINYKDYRIRQQLRVVFEVRVTQLEYLSEVQRDKSRVRKAEGIVNQISELARQSPDSWMNIITLGGWKMLQTCGLPALLDDVLEEGFSPESWTVEAVASCPKLALDLAQKWEKIERFDDAIAFFDKQVIKLSELIFVPPIPNDEVIGKVKKILKWVEIKEELTEQNVKTLTFFWLVFLVLEHVNLLPCSSEYSARLFDKIWSYLEKLLGKKQMELVSELENMTQTLADKGIASAPEIMRFPEVIM